MSHEDLLDIDPSRGEFVNSLMDLVTQKQALLATLENEPEETKFKALSELTMDLKGNAVKLEDLSLTFQVGLAMFACMMLQPCTGFADYVSQ